MINLFALGLVLFGCFLGGVGAVLVKKGAPEFSLGKIWRAWKNKFLVGGLSLYVVSTVFYMVALRWEELSVLYPMVATTYIWTIFFSIKYLGEKMNKWKWIGLSGIVLGIVLIGLSG